MAGSTKLEAPGRGSGYKVRKQLQRGEALGGLRGLAKGSLLHLCKGRDATGEASIHWDGEL